MVQRGLRCVWLACGESLLGVRRVQPRGVRTVLFMGVGVRYGGSVEGDKWIERGREGGWTKWGELRHEQKACARLHKGD